MDWIGLLGRKFVWIWLGMSGFGVIMLGIVDARIFCGEVELLWKLFVLLLLFITLLLMFEMLLLVGCR